MREPNDPARDLDGDSDNDDDHTFENGKWRPLNKANSRPHSSSSLREVRKARKVAGSIIVSLPKSLRDRLGIDTGDRLMISLDEHYQSLVITKE